MVCTTIHLLPPRPRRKEKGHRSVHRIKVKTKEPTSSRGYDCRGRAAIAARRSMCTTARRSLDAELRAAPVPAVLVVLDLAVRLEAEPVRQRTVLLHLLRERALRAEGLLGRLWIGREGKCVSNSVLPRLRHKQSDSGSPPPAGAGAPVVRGRNRPATPRRPSPERASRLRIRAAAARARGVGQRPAAPLRAGPCAPATPLVRAPPAHGARRSAPAARPPAAAHPEAMPQGRAPSSRAELAPGRRPERCPPTVRADAPSRPRARAPDARPGATPRPLAGGSLPGGARRRSMPLASNVPFLRLCLPHGVRRRGAARSDRSLPGRCWACSYWDPGAANGDRPRRRLWDGAIASVPRPRCLSIFLKLNISNGIFLRELRGRGVAEPPERPIRARGGDPGGGSRGWVRERDEGRGTEGTCGGGRGRPRPPRRNTRNMPRLAGRRWRRARN